MTNTKMIQFCYLAIRTMHTVYYPKVLFYSFHRAFVVHELALWINSCRLRNIGTKCDMIKTCLALF